MVKGRDSNAFPSRSTAWPAMDSASCSPDCDWGAAMTGQAFSTRQAFTVKSSGSPGPTLTP